MKKREQGSDWSVILEKIDQIIVLIQLMRKERKNFYDSYETKRLLDN